MHIKMYMMAHRGFSGYYPENTITALKEGIKANFDSLEFDVRLSKDEVPVVIHDATINRTSNGGRQYIHDLTVNELKQYDYGSWFDPKYAGERSEERRVGKKGANEMGECVVM